MAQRVNPINEVLLVSLVEVIIATKLAEWLSERHC